MEAKGSLAVRLVEGGQLLKFTSHEAEAIVKTVGEIISRWQNQQPVSGMTSLCGSGLSSSEPVYSSQMATWSMAR